MEAARLELGPAPSRAGLGPALHNSLQALDLGSPARVLFLLPLN